MTVLIKSILNNYQQENTCKKKHNIELILCLYLLRYLAIYEKLHTHTLLYSTYYHSKRHTVSNILKLLLIPTLSL